MKLDKVVVTEMIGKNVEVEGVMNTAEKDELIARVHGMSQEELRIVVENIPVELCLERIQSELDKAKALELSLKNIMNGLH